MGGQSGGLAWSVALESPELERRAVRAKDVRIAISYSGICHSDVHQARSEWGNDIFPMVPGHEIIGEVIEVGAEVTKFKIGQTVGVGVFVDSCRECDACKSNLESYCEKGPVGSYNGYAYNGDVEYGGNREESAHGVCEQDSITRVHRLEHSEIVARHRHGADAIRPDRGLAVAALA